MLLTVHHVAASGGSIVSQVLAASTNSVLVSEINPLGTVYRGLEPFYDPTSLLWHLVYNSRDLSPTLKLKYFFGQIEISIEHVKSLSKNLLLRDHSHSTFNFLNKNQTFNNKKVDSFFLESLKYFYSKKKDMFDFPRIKPILSIRHPLDSFIASRKKNWLFEYCGDDINIDNYCKGLLNFQNYMENVEFAKVIRYEDLCMNFESSLNELFLDFNINYKIPTLSEVNRIKVTGKSGRKSNDIVLRDRLLVDVDNGLKNQIKESIYYKQFCQKNNYDPNYNQPPINNKK